MLYAWLRLAAGLVAGAAYEDAIRRAAGARRHVDLRDIIAAPPAA